MTMWGSLCPKMGFMNGRKRIGKSWFTLLDLTTCKCGNVCEITGRYGWPNMCNPPEREEHTGTVQQKV